MSEQESQGSSTLGDLGNGITLEARTDFTAILAEEVPLAGRCETCKWWKQYRKSACGHDKMSPGNNESDGASDCEEYGGIFTVPQFGCIHHEKK